MSCLLLRGDSRLSISFLTMPLTPKFPPMP